MALCTVATANKFSVLLLLGGASKCHLGLLIFCRDELVRREVAPTSDPLANRLVQLTQLHRRVF